MARQITVRTLCDVHLAKGEQVDGRELTVALDGAKPRVLALCEPCYADLWAPVLALVSEHGQPVPTDAAAQPTTAPGRRLPCPFPDCTKVGDSSTLSSHVRHVHGMGLVAAREANGVQQVKRGRAPRG